MYTNWLGCKLAQAGAVRVLCTAIYMAHRLIDIGIAAKRLSDTEVRSLGLLARSETRQSPISRSSHVESG